MNKYLALFLVVASFFSTAYAVQDAAPIKVYGTPLSPFVRKVISVMEYKKIEYRLDPTLPSVALKAQGKEISREFEEASPLGKIPAIKVQEGTLADSSVIIAYLEKKFPGKPVYPADPFLMAKSLWFEQYAGTEINDVFNKIFFERVVKPIELKLTTDEAVVNQLLLKAPPLLSYLEKSLKDSKTNYLVSNELTIGDIAVIHQFIGLDIAKVSLDLSEYPLLRAYINRGKNHPVIQIQLAPLNHA